jgi:hypothetical protein
MFLKKKLIDTIFFYSTLKSNFVRFHQSQLQAIVPKKGSHFERKYYKNLCLRYSKIFIYHIILR